MEHLNIFIFFILGQTLENLKIHTSVQGNYSMFQGSLALAKTALELLLKGTARYQLKESAQAGNSLWRVLEDLQQAASKAAPTDRLTPELASSFGAALGSFESAINLELGRAPIFWVKPKSIFDTSAMITKASMAFTDGVILKLPKEAIDDTDQAGRCLAFSLGTAAGFHIARATEAVIKRYMEVFGCPPLKESQRNWGNYIRALREQGANKKVIAHLEQIKDLHRNPLIHPEVHLGLGEAVTLFMICMSAIQGMVADMEVRQNVPVADRLAALPPDEEAAI